ncbi:nuclear transport factor 2 family protein [Arthrobacter sp. efr-133-TYG-104]|uniref:nuclear transport factor 2 family protein n=1 Tax=Arthrobacter sp. efr-133-TYG-104 TaxID=3040324 RepID=UPI002549F7E8|nr:nuclear transport factor 2 family protein [Arthrobacter sp. efr-133-TYG-104]
MSDTEVDALVRRYYLLVDAGDIEGLLALFTEDAVYERQGSQKMNGKEQMRLFYQSQRVIESGKHSLEAVVPGDTWVAVRGVFRGTLKDGERVNVPFTDWYKFNGLRIAHRQTLFPARTI